MKKLLYIIIAFIAFGFISCRKSIDNLNIKQFDDNSIKTYMDANGLTPVMHRDTSGGDTTGIYYQIIKPVNGSAVVYSTVVSYAYSYHTFDGEFASADTIFNHTNTFLGHVTPIAVQLAIKNILKQKGGVIRLLIPSRLAFGTNGYFAGNIHINGNQCLDYTVSLVNNDVRYVPNTSKPMRNRLTGELITNQTVYDSISIKKYIAANNLTGYNTVTSKSGYTYWYKVITPGTGTDPISLTSTVGVQYTGYLLNNNAFDTQVTTDGSAAITFTLFDEVDGFSDALSRTTAGGQVSFILPSALGFGDPLYNTIPAFSCLRFDVTVVSVTN